MGRKLRFDTRNKQQSRSAATLPSVILPHNNATETVVSLPTRVPLPTPSQGTGMVATLPFDVDVPSSPFQTAIFSLPRADSDAVDISLPLSAYTSARLPSVAALHSRLMHSSFLLPAEWICLVCNKSLALYKLYVAPPVMSHTC